jgi:hypothetical protein
MGKRKLGIRVIVLLASNIAGAGCGNNPSTGEPGLMGTGGDSATGGTGSDATAGTGGDSASGGSGLAGTAGAGGVPGAGGTGVDDTAGAGGTTSGDAGVDGVPDAGAGTSGGTGGTGGTAFTPVPYGTVNGPFRAVTITGTGPNNDYNVYHPAELGREGVKHPVLTWGNGATTTPDAYRLLPALASHGFVVIASRSRFVNGALLKDGLEWMLAQNAASGPFQGHLDPERVGAFGYSLGSLATFSIGTDPLLKTTVHISGGIMNAANQGQATALTRPTAYFCDRNETAVNCDSDFAVVGSAPTFYGTVAGVHVDYVINARFIERFNVAVIAWFRWQLMDDAAMAPVFEGANCTLCADPAWAVQKKNMP